MSAFLTTDGLPCVLRKVYHQGNLTITLATLLKKITIGAYRVMLKRNFDTACWVPPVGSRGSHSIYYGDRMLLRTIDYYISQSGVKVESRDQITLRITAEREAAAVKASKRRKKPLVAVPVTSTEVIDIQLNSLKGSLSLEQWKEFIALMEKSVSAYGRHERAHATETTQDLKKVNAELKLFGIPFSIFNWFEDARIESISRNQHSKPFEWLAVEDICALSSHPIALFARRIQLEEKVDEDALDATDSAIQGTAERIAYYYESAIKAPTSEHLYPLMKEFVTEFKEHISDPPALTGTHFHAESIDGGDDDAGDLSEAAQATEKGDEFFNEFEADAEVVAGTDEEGKKAEGGLPPESGKSGPKATPVESGTIVATEKGGRAPESKLLAEHPGKLDKAYEERLQALIKILMKMFKSNTLNMAVETPGHRLSSRHLAKGELKYVHKRAFGGISKRKYDILYDCSGSMGGQPDREGKLLLLALNALAKRGLVEGNLILTGWNGKSNCWVKFKLPVADSIILRIRTNCSAEGLQGALVDNLQTLAVADDVYIYTDANITDLPIDRDFFKRRGIQPVGLYVGESTHSANMDEHFPQNIVDITIERVVERMLLRKKR